MEEDLVLIVGHGRSGTNWLLEMLDLSSRTHCRNEPNVIRDSPLTAIHAELIDPSNDAELDEHWDSAVAWAAERQGERDLARN